MKINCTLLAFYISPQFRKKMPPSTLLGGRSAYPDTPWLRHWMNPVKVIHQNDSHPIGCSNQLNVPFLEPVMFNGMNWEGSITQFINSIAVYCGWDNDIRLLRLLHHVTDEAAQFVYHMCDGAAEASYEKLNKTMPFERWKWTLVSNYILVTAA